MARKLGMPTEHRLAVLKSQASSLLWYGKIETTLEKAKEVRSITEKLITLAMSAYQDTVEITKVKTVLDKKGVEKEVKIPSINDGAKKLAARRKLMAELIDLQEIKSKKESKTAYYERTKEVNHPLIEKLFNEIAPKYEKLAKEKGQRGGYTRVLKLGPRRGDAAEMAIVELI